MMIGLSLFLVLSSYGQTIDTTKAPKTKVETFANVGFVSQWVWRGTILDNKPNIQPLVGLTYGGLELGAVGSLSTLNNYCEADLYATYKYKFMKISITDFYIDLSGTANSQNYFDYSDTACGHHIMADLVFLGTEKIPVKITVSTMLYGGWDQDSIGKSKYTTYLEARYLYKGWEIFAGALTGQSDFYLNDGSGFNIVNVGALYNYSIKFNEKFSLPTAVQVCVNPQMKKFYLTFGVTF